MSAVFATPNCVIPDLIGNPWPAFACSRDGQAMDSRFRGNDNKFIVEESAQ
jgi:hypothetical protein